MPWYTFGRGIKIQGDGDPINITARHGTCTCTCTTLEGNTMSYKFTVELGNQSWQWETHGTLYHAIVTSISNSKVHMDIDAIFSRVVPSVFLSWCGARWRPPLRISILFGNNRPDITFGNPSVAIQAWRRHNIYRMVYMWWSNKYY
jgi:hypothetical protein